MSRSPTFRFRPSSRTTPALGLGLMLLLIILIACNEIRLTQLEPLSSQAVVSFTLIDADTDGPIPGFDPLPSGAVLDLATLPTKNLNVRANTSPHTVGSVRFSLGANSNYRTENGAPYALAGDSDGDYHPWTPPLGNYTLKATPFTRANAKGTAGTSLTITFSVTESPPALEPPPATEFTTLSWTSVSALPLGVTDAQGAALDGKLYVFGGYSSWTPFCTTTEARVYDLVANTWTKLADMPAAWSHAGVAVDGRTFHVAGAYLNDPNCDRSEVATTAVYSYDVDGKLWSRSLPPLPQPRGSGGLVRLGRNLHFFGGTDSGRADKGNHWTLSLDDTPKGWTVAAALPNPRSHFGYVALNGAIYAIGGQHGYEETAVAQTSVHRYNPVANAWTEVASLPLPLSHISASTLVMEDRIIVVGGERGHNLDVDRVLAYDPRRDLWTSLTPLPVKRKAGVAGVLDGKIVFTGGSNLSKRTYLGVPDK